jgi:putative FmdB family regulatory protein
VPAYDYRCNACNRRFVLKYKTYAEYDSATKTCVHCGSQNVRRYMTTVGIARSETSRFDSLDDDRLINELESADPSTLGRYMRRVADEAGEDLGQEFNEVVERLERGEDPEAIEASLALPDDASGGDDVEVRGGDIGIGGAGIDSVADSDIPVTSAPAVDSGID